MVKGCSFTMFQAEQLVLNSIMTLAGIPSSAVKIVDVLSHSGDADKVKIIQLLLLADAQVNAAEIFGQFMIFGYTNGSKVLADVIRTMAYWLKKGNTLSLDCHRIKET